MHLTPETRTRAEQWLSPVFDEQTRKAVEALMSENPKEAEDSFYKNLDFGTGGLRGEMGVGTNRINLYTVGMATQGLSQYVLSHGPASPSVAIAYDSRNRSDEFAKRAADVLSANGIKVYLFDSLRPTPLLSYTVRELKCTAGIVITASHNPKEYNGYKVYWSDGGQLVPPHDNGVISEVRKVSSPNQVKSPAQAELINAVPSHIEESYYAAINGLIKEESKGEAKRALKIVFTSLHGTGITMIPKALSNAGFKTVKVLAAQQEPDGDFPTVKSPNPEETSAMQMAIEAGEQEQADLILGTDPDADRVGLGVRDEQGKMSLLNGNQAAALLIHYLLSTATNTELESGFIAKTIVTSDLLSEIARLHDVPCYETLTGFKYIAELIGKLEGQLSFIGGGEESYGYLVGDFVRDKDAVISSVILCEMAAWCHREGKSVYEMLIHVYERYGLYRETLVSLVKKGKQGAADISALMDEYRTSPPSEIGGVAVLETADYKTGTVKDSSGTVARKIDLPSSNVIQFTLSDGSKVTARPSGTEPKIKYYVSVRQEMAGQSFEHSWSAAGEKIEAIKKSLGI